MINSGCSDWFLDSEDLYSMPFCPYALNDLLLNFNQKKSTELSIEFTDCYIDYLKDSFPDFDRFSILYNELNKLEVSTLDSLIFIIKLYIQEIINKIQFFEFITELIRENSKLYILLADLISKKRIHTMKQKLFYKTKKDTLVPKQVSSLENIDFFEDIIFTDKMVTNMFLELGKKDNLTTDDINILFNYVIKDQDYNINMFLNDNFGMKALKSIIDLKKSDIEIRKFLFYIVKPRSIDKLQIGYRSNYKNFNESETSEESESSSSSTKDDEDVKVDKSSETGNTQTSSSSSSTGSDSSSDSSSGSESDTSSSEEDGHMIIPMPKEFNYYIHIINILSYIWNKPVDMIPVIDIFNVIDAFVDKDRELVCTESIIEMLTVFAACIEQINISDSFNNNVSQIISYELSIVNGFTVKDSRYQEICEKCSLNGKLRSLINKLLEYGETFKRERYVRYIQIQMNILSKRSSSKGLFTKEIQKIFENETLYKISFSKISEKMLIIEEES